MSNVIDAHFHMGSCRVFDYPGYDEDVILDVMEKNDIGGMIIQPYPGSPDLAGTHDRIAALTKQTNGRIRGLASVNPHQDEDTYFAEVERCVKELNFVGVKLHTIGHAINPRTSDAEKVFETARQLDIPVMVHTGPGIPFADPAMVAPRARQFPDVTIILGHAGHGMFTGGAISMAETFDNIVMETSWSRAPDIAMMVNHLGTRRVMLGTDHPGNVATELTKYRTGNLTAEQLEESMGKTATEVFKLDR